VVAASFEKIDRVDAVEKKLNFSVVEPRGAGKGQRRKQRS